MLVEEYPHFRLCTLGEQHRHNLLRRAVAEELAEGLLVVGNAMLLDQRDEIRGV